MSVPASCRVLRFRYSTSLAFVVALTVAFHTASRGTAAVLSTPVVAPLSPSLVASFRGDNLHDLARLCRPMEVAGKTEKGLDIKLTLRDALYAGAKDGRAQLLSLWVIESSFSDEDVLRLDDAARTPARVAERLAQGAMLDKSFAVGLLEVSWSKWELTVSRTDNFIWSDRSTDPAAKDPLSVESLPSVLLTKDTRAITVPAALGMTMQTSWQPWFEQGQVVLSIRRLHSGEPELVVPDTRVLDGKAGIVIADEFLTGWFGEVFKARDLTIRQGSDVHHISNLRFRSEPPRFVASGQVGSAPEPAVVRMALVFEGDDPVLSKVVVESIECRGIPGMDCNALKVRASAGALLLTGELRSKSLKPPETVQQLGNHFIDTKPVAGTVFIDQFRVADRALAIICVLRLRSGDL